MTVRIIHFVPQVIKILSGNLGTVELKTEPLPYAGESHLPHDAGGPTIPGTFIETGNLPYAGESHIIHDAGGPTIPGTLIVTVTLPYAGPISTTIPGVPLFQVQ